VVDTDGATVKFRTRRDAEQAANDAEARIRNGGRPPRVAGRMVFAEYVNDWYARQELALSTMQSYRRTIEDHLLPAFGESAVAAISPADVALWEKRERAIIECAPWFGEAVADRSAPRSACATKLIDRQLDHLSLWLTALEQVRRSTHRLLRHSGYQFRA
jgi:hypothetical protein